MNIIKNGTTEVSEELIPNNGWKNFPSRDIPSMFNYDHVYPYLTDNEELGCGHDTVTAKPLKKGRNLLESNFVENVQDNSLPNGDYVFRAHVHHSMKKLLPLNVSVVLSGASGNIKNCSCKASEYNRCTHVTALLLYLDNFVKK